MATGCGSGVTELELNFPSLETFLYSSFGRVQVYDLTPAEVGLCPTLIRQSMRGTPSRAAIRDSGDQPVCEFRNGGVAFSEISEGPKAFVAMVSDASNRTLLTGCSVAEVYDEAAPIVIRLYMSDQYSTAVQDIGSLECGSIEDKCDRGCGG